MNNAPGRLAEDVNVVWLIASKDIVDSLKNRLVVSLILTVSIIMLVPKMLPLIFDQPVTVLPVYDAGTSSLVTILKGDPNVVVQEVRSTEEMRPALCQSTYSELGLVVPTDFDEVVQAGGQPTLKGFVCWGKRFEAAGLRSKAEALISQAVGRPVLINTKGNIVYPPSDSGLSLGMATLNSVVMILAMGIVLVPSLLFEEKQTRTMDALLVSPASIGKVVAGKALAGFFYVLVTGALVFAINWADVTHWGVAVLFVVSGGMFAVAMGLVMGSFLGSQQDSTAWMSVLIVVLVGAMLIKMMGMELPAAAQAILPWVPSVVLAEICLAAFSESVSLAQLGRNLGIMLAISLLLYALVAWKVRRSDR